MENKYHKYLPLVAGVTLLFAVTTWFPYSYYQLLRWVVSGVALFCAYSAWQQKKQNWMFMMIGLAIVFNPIAPFFLAKQTWRIFDVVAAMIMFSYSSNQGK